MEKTIFKRASRTYYYSSLFFPGRIRDDVFKLYSFVRMADDFVDQTPQDKAGFLEFKKQWAEISELKETGSGVSGEPRENAVKNMAYLVKTYNFHAEWVDAFLTAMESDFKKPHYKTLDDSLTYVYGSAEVIGLMMAKLLGLAEDALTAAKLQGRAMQWINFVRDIDEDNGLDRQYFPKKDLKRFGLSDLSQETAEKNPDAFKKFIQLQIGRYDAWQHEAERGYKYIPKRSLVAIKTASDMYGWTARTIEKDPLVIFKRKVKPSKARVLAQALKNSV